MKDIGNVYTNMVYVLLIAFLCLYPTPSGSVDYYVTPTSPPNTDCPLPCNTLDQYAQTSSLLSNKDNVSLLFLEGLHTLNHILRISRTKQLSLTQVHSGSKVIIKCNSAGFHFRDVKHFEIGNLTLLWAGCAGRQD